MSTGREDARAGSRWWKDKFSSGPAVTFTQPPAPGTHTGLFAAVTEAISAPPLELCPPWRIGCLWRSYGIRQRSTRDGGGVWIRWPPPSSWRGPFTATVAIVP